MATDNLARGMAAKALQSGEAGVANILNGTTPAGRVGHKLTATLNGTTVEYDGSQSISIVVDTTPYATKTQAAGNLTLSIDSKTYVMTVTLTSISGAVLATETVDLPLETMVVGGKMSDDGQSIILTLQNGETVQFSVSALVSGLVSQTDFDDEVAARQAADTALQSSIDEVSQAVTDEATARQAADTALQTSVTEAQNTATAASTTASAASTTATAASNTATAAQTAATAAQTTANNIVSGDTPAGKVANALTFTGGATGTYDGSAAVSVEIPSYTFATTADVYELFE